MYRWGAKVGAKVGCVDATVSCPLLNPSLVRVVPGEGWEVMMHDVWKKCGYISLHFALKK